MAEEGSDMEIPEERNFDDPKEEGEALNMSLKMEKVISLQNPEGPGEDLEITEADPTP